MRDPNRLYKIYNELALIQAKSFPDMREGQYMLNLLGWINSNKKRDPFFIEGAELIEYAKEYANHVSIFYQGWTLKEMQ